MIFDITMPLTLFTITLIALIVERLTNRRIQTIFEEKKIGLKESIMLVLGMGTMVSLIAFIPQFAILLLFLFAYSLLLFMFTYLFSDFSKKWANLFYAVSFMISSVVTVFSLYINNIFATLGFLGLFGFTLLIFSYDQTQKSRDERWFLAVLPPAFFVLFYFFFGNSTLWFPWLLDLYGSIFAILIIVYVSSLFSWKTTLVFVSMLTIMDVILVLVTGSMVSAVRGISALRLPILISMPIIPVIYINGNVAFLSLGLGDFFFAGLLTIQTSKLFGRTSAIISLLGMSLSFFIFETMLLSFEIGAFPGTVMIIIGWISVVIGKIIKDFLSSRGTQKQQSI